MATSSGDESSPRAAADLVVLPTYPEMIVEAIASLRDANANGSGSGSSQAAIARRIEATHGAAGGLPPSHPALVAAHLSRMSAANELVAVAGGKYALPPPPSRPPVQEEEMEEDEDDEEEEESDDAPAPPPLPPAKRGRGRGRPPKALTPSNGLPVAAAAPAVPRRRGRPPKPRDPDAPPKIARPRGRPRKNPLPEGMVLVARPRGRPRKNPLPEGMVLVPRPGPNTAKPRPQFAEVGFV